MPVHHWQWVLSVQEDPRGGCPWAGTKGVHSKRCGGGTPTDWSRGGDLPALKPWPTQGWSGPVTGLWHTRGLQGNRCGGGLRTWEEQQLWRQDQLSTWPPGPCWPTAMLQHCSGQLDPTAVGLGQKGRGGTGVPTGTVPSHLLQPMKRGMGLAWQLQLQLQQELLAVRKPRVPRSLPLLGAGAGHQQQSQSQVQSSNDMREKMGGGVGDRA